jgi:copper transport protein
MDLMQARSPKRHVVTRRVRWMLAAVVALLLLAMATVTVQAHALPVGSDPAPGDILQQPPRAVTMIFNEAPDPALSYIKVLDTAGNHYEEGTATPKPYDPRILTVAVRQLGKGVYTVAWRTVASDDGHRITGSFAFGVQVSPPPPVLQQQEPETSALTFSAGLTRAAFYIGLVGLLGAAFIASSRISAVWKRLYPVLAGSCLLAIVGGIGITDSQLRSVETGWVELFNTTLAGSLLTRVAPLLVTGVALVAASRVSVHARRVVLVIVGLGAALSMLADSAANHAATEAIPAISIALQWLHILAAGLWIGALAALLLVISAIPADSRRQLIERYAIGAVISLLIIAATGIIRSLEAIGSWDHLFTTLYGTIVIAKVVLLVVLAFLGVLHRFNLSRPHPPEQGFRRIGSMQVVAGVAALVLSAALVNVAPPSAVSAASTSPAPLITTGTDGSMIKVRLEVSPGIAGFNHFALTLQDYSTGSPISNASVTLGFLFAGRGGVGASSLILPSLGNGAYGADGANISLTGPWNITAEVAVKGVTYEIPLQLTTRT